MPTNPNDLKRLLDLVEKPVVSWGNSNEGPTPGSTVVGTVTGVGMSAEGKYGAYPIVEVDTGDEIVAIHAFHTLLKSELRKAQILDTFDGPCDRAIGAMIVAKYFGRVTNPRSGDADMGRYRVVSEFPSAATE